MNPKVKAVLDAILDQFQNSDNIPESIALLTFPSVVIPMNSWSLLNKLTCIFSHSNDVRGYRQWQDVKRQVKAGAHAIHILVPFFKKEKDENDEELTTLVNFITAPVFRLEDTEGEPLDYRSIPLPELPLIERAIELGVDVKTVPKNYGHYGFFSSQTKTIGLASPEECVFFHELTHLADFKLNGELKNGQDPIQEITAELGALALGFILGKDGSKHLGNHYRYIEKYASEMDISPYTAVLKVISRTEKILNLILKGGSSGETVDQIQNPSLEVPGNLSQVSRTD